MSVVVEAYHADRRERGLAASSIERDEYHLRALLQLERNGARPIEWLTPRRGAELYEAMRSRPIGARGKYRADTHRGALAAGRKLGKFALERGWLRVSPFGAVKGIGKRSRGKPQLHLDEARRLIEKCLAERSRASVGVAACFLLGFRVSEVAHRRIRDLDDGGRLLWVVKGKTPAASRCSEVPDVLRPLLLELAGGRPSAAYLLGVGELDRPSRHWLAWHCRRLCREAGVPVVTPHGLRGTHATLATAAGATSQVVASALGHTSAAITESTYIAPGAKARAGRSRVLSVLDGGLR